MVEQDTHRVTKLGPNGAFLATWGGEGSGAGELWFPYDIAVDAGGGGVYVTDNSNYRIEKFDTSGNFISAWGWGVADGSAAYQVCTTRLPGRHRRHRRRMQFGSRSALPPTAPTSMWPTTTTSASRSSISPEPSVGQWAIPGGQQPGVAVGRRGKVYVTTGADAIWRFDTNGVPDGSWDGDGVTGLHRQRRGAARVPEGIAVDGSGVYVADSNNHRISKFDLSGTFQAAWGTQGTGDGQFSWPQGVLATGGSVWVADSYNHRLQRFSQGGHPSAHGGHAAWRRRLLLPRRRRHDPLRRGVYVAAGRHRRPAARRVRHPDRAGGAPHRARLQRHAHRERRRTCPSAATM